MLCLKSDVYRVNKKGDSTMSWGALADHHIGLTILKPHILWSVGEIIRDPCSQATDYSSTSQCHLEEERLNHVKSTGKVKKYDSCSASRSF